MTTVSKFAESFNATLTSGRYLQPKDKAEIHGLSVTSVMLQMKFGKQLLAKGTGWFWRTSQGVALVTAWHNFSGLHHTKRVALSPNGGMPDRVYFRYMAKNPKTFQDVEIPLYIDEERTLPRWFVHPVCGSYFDMAFMLLDIKNGDVSCINDTIPIIENDIPPGSDVFAIGFPQGVGMLSVFAVWKRGSIASDVDLPVEGHPKFLVDIAGRGGLSGAPVFRVQQGVILEPTPEGQRVGFGEKIEFLGIYSGRIGDQLPGPLRSGESSDLGFVWRNDIVLEMLKGGVLDEQPEFGKGTVELTEIWESGSEAAP